MVRRFAFGLSKYPFENMAILARGDGCNHPELDRSLPYVKHGSSCVLRICSTCCHCQSAIGSVVDYDLQPDPGILRPSRICSPRDDRRYLGTGIPRNRRRHLATSDLFLVPLDGRYRAASLARPHAIKSKQIAEKTRCLNGLRFPCFTPYL